MWRETRSREGKGNYNQDLLHQSNLFSIKEKEIKNGNVIRISEDVLLVMIKSRCEE